LVNDEAVLQVRLPWPADLQLHLVNSFYVVCSVAVSSRPFKPTQVHVPLAALSAYSVFSFAYHLAGGRNTLGQEFIYPFLDFSDLPRFFAFGAILVIATVLGHCFLAVVDVMAARFLSKAKPPTQTEAKDAEQQET
jgi:hypothetical protein